MRPAPVRLALALATVVGLTTQKALAQSDEERAGARAAATSGLSAMDEGKWQEAIDRFTRAETLVHAPPHLLYIARANVKLGRLVRARENYLRILKEDLPAGAPKAFRDARASASEEIGALEGRIPTLKVIVTGNGATEATILMDGQKLAAAMSGVPVPIDPGAHEFLARTASLESPKVAVNLREGAKESLSLELKIPRPIEKEPAGPPTDLRAAEEPPPKGDGRRTAGFVALGVAGGAAIFGTIFLFRNRSDRSSADELCTPACPESSRSRITALDEAANTSRTLSWIGFGVAGGAAIVGTALLVTSGSGRDKEMGASKAHLALHPTLGGAVLGGSF